MAQVQEILARGIERVRTEMEDVADKAKDGIVEEEEEVEEVRCFLFVLLVFLHISRLRPIQIFWFSEPDAEPN